MFEYLTHEHAMIMQGVVFLAVIGFFKIIELLINRQFVGLGHIVGSLLLFLIIGLFKH